MKTLFGRIILWVGFVAITSGCTMSYNLEDLKSVLTPTPQRALTGTIGPVGFSIQSGGCTSLALYRTNATGEKSTLVDTISPLVDKNFSFQNAPDITQHTFLLEATCGAYNFQRFVTATTEQNVDFGSTVVSWFPHVAAPVPQIATVSLNNLGEIYEQLKNSTSFENAYTSLSTTHASQYQLATGVLASTLRQASPQLISSTLPSSCNEQSICNLEAQFFHWSASFTPGKTWKAISLPSNTESIVPSAVTFDRNSQGAKKIKLTIGHSDLTVDNLTDPTKPHKEFEWDLTVNNTFPAMAPAATAMPSNPPTEIVNTVGGRIYTNTAVFSFNFNPQELVSGYEMCETFSRVAVTEDTAATPSLPSSAISAFSGGGTAVTCSSANPFDLTYTLSTQARRYYKIWSQDSDNNISQLPTVFDVTYDVTNPTVNITLPANNATILQGDTIELNWTLVEDNLDQIDVQYTTNGTTWISGVLNTNLTFNPTFTAANLQLPNTATSNGGLRLVVTDLAGNSTTSNTIAFSTVTPATSPTLTLASGQSALTNSTSVNLSYNCNGGTHIYFSLSSTNPGIADSGWMDCSGGPDHTFTLNNTDGLQRIYAWTKNALTTSVSVNVAVTLDRTAPLITGVTLAQTQTNTPYVDVTFNGTDATGVTAYCVIPRLRSASAPASTAGCTWSSIASQTSLATTTSTFLGDQNPPQTYVIDVWLRDALANESLISSTPEITYIQPTPATLTKLMASTSLASAFPPALNEQELSAPSELYIKWNFTPGTGFTLADYDLKLFYSSNGTDYTEVPAPNVEPCSTTPAGFTHCLKTTTAMSNTTYHQYKVTAFYGFLETTSTTVPLNITPSGSSHKFRIIAGDQTLSASEVANASTLAVPTDHWAPDYIHSFAVDSHGIIYILDNVKGLLKYSPQTGAVEVMHSQIEKNFPYSYQPSLYDGILGQPGVKIFYTANLFIDLDDNLLIYDAGGIRRLNTTTRTLTTLISGSNSMPFPRAETPASAFFAGGAMNTETRSRNQIWPLPNGNFIFRSGTPYHTPQYSQLFSVYNSATNTVREFQIQGTYDVSTSPTNAAGSDNASTKETVDASFKINPVTGLIENAFVWTKIANNQVGDLNSITADISPGAPQAWTPTGALNLNAGTWERFFVNNPYNSNMYRFSDSIIEHYNGSTWETIAGNGTVGSCDDSVEAIDCSLTIRHVASNSLNQLFVWDGNRIRRFTSKNEPLITVVGSKTTDTSSGPALAAKISRLSSLAVRTHPATLLTSIGYYDDNTKLIREITFTGNSSPLMDVIAGNGNNAPPLKNTPAFNQPVAVQRENTLFYDSNSNLHITMSHHELGHMELDRTTGFWNFLIGTSKPGWPADFVLDNQTNNGNGTDLLNPSRIRGQLFEVAYIDDDFSIIQNRYGNYNSLTLYDRRDNYRQYMLMDSTSISNTSNPNQISINGSLPFQSNGAPFTRDKTSTTDEILVHMTGDGLHRNYIFRYPIPKTLFESTGKYSSTITDAGDWATYYVSKADAIAENGSEFLRTYQLHANASGFTSYRRVNSSTMVSELFIAYCTDNGEFWIKNVTANSASVRYNTQASNFTCDSKRIAYDAQRGSIFFGFKQNGILGIAELEIP